MGEGLLCVAGVFLRSNPEPELSRPRTAAHFGSGQPRSEPPPAPHPAAVGPSLLPVSHLLSHIHRYMQHREIPSYHLLLRKVLLLRITLCHRALHLKLLPFPYLCTSMATFKQLIPSVVLSTTGSCSRVFEIIKLLVANIFTVFTIALLYVTL